MAVLLTWNPAKWTVSDEEYRANVETTAAGRIVKNVSWSVGRRRQGIEVGERAYWLRQGKDQRGIVGAGHILSEPYLDAHWDGSGKEQSYVDVAWDKVVHLADRLPVEDLKLEVSEVPWSNIMGSGFSFDDEVAAKIDLLWESGNLGTPAVPAVGRKLGSTAAKVIVELYALDRAIEYLSEAGWAEIEVHGKPFDISCSKDGVELHVEVKGLTSTSSNVTLTYNEVEHAHSWNPTMLIVVRGILIKGKGARTRASGGSMTVFDDWVPDRDSLRPRQYEYPLPM